MAYFSVQCCHDFRVTTEQAMSTRPSITGRRWGEEEEKANKKKNNYIVLPEQEQAVVLYKICSEEQVIQIIINSKQ